MQEQIFASPIEALKHLIENWDGALPVDLNQAKYRISDGIRYTKTSNKVYPLKSAGALSMLRKYGGGRYSITEVVVFTETKPETL